MGQGPKRICQRSHCNVCGAGAMFIISRHKMHEPLCEGCFEWLLENSTQEIIFARLDSHCDCSPIIGMRPRGTKPASTLTEKRQPFGAAIQDRAYYQSYYEKNRGRILERAKLRNRARGAA